MVAKAFLERNMRGFFGLPAKEMNLSKANKYISDICKNNCYGLYIHEPDLREIGKLF